MLWDVFIHKPRSGVTVTKQIEVPNTTGMADVRSVYLAAERAGYGREEDMFAVPAKGVRKRRRR